jgi:hypothetical protein
VRSRTPPRDLDGLPFTRPRERGEVDPLDLFDDVLELVGDELAVVGHQRHLDHRAHQPQRVPGEPGAAARQAMPRGEQSGIHTARRAADRRNGQQIGWFPAAVACCPMRLFPTTT